ncbi:hypothetical protein D3C77_272210 [compost metagenome]
MPDDAALAPTQVALRFVDAEVLVMPAELFHPAVEHDVIVDQLQKARLIAQLEQIPIQQVVGSVALFALFLPGQVVLLAGLDGAVAQSLGIVAGHHVLHGGEERLDELGLLVVQALSDTLVHRHLGSLQLQHAQGNTVYIEYDIRAFAICLGIRALDGNFLGNGEVVFVGLFPVDQPDGLCVFAHLWFEFHPVAQQFVH